MSNNDLTHNLRIQDIVARTARVNLRDTVRVLRALAHVSNSVYADPALTTKLNTLLYDGARMSNFPAPLHSKPDARAKDACDAAYNALADDIGDSLLEALFNLDDDPYFRSRTAAPSVDGE